MFFPKPIVLPGFVCDLFNLSDPTFYNLLGFLAIIVFLRLFLPLHSLMSRELFRRNEITDLAEEARCNEYDVFVTAHDFYYGHIQSARIKQDFINYLRHWPDNYILPFYVRNFLAEQARDKTDSRHDCPDDHIKIIILV